MADKSDQQPDANVNRTAICNATNVVSITQKPTTTTTDNSNSTNVPISSSSSSSSSSLSLSLSQNSDNDIIIQPQSTCNCTKISIMLLIHEMKQKFPTVPDHIINQYVMDNCHDRVTCVDRLEAEAENHPGSVQAYPQALRHTKRPTVPRRVAPSIPNHPHHHLHHHHHQNISSSNNQRHTNDNIVKSNHHQQQLNKTTTNFLSSAKNQVTLSDSNVSDMPNENNGEIIKAKQIIPPQRPNTLSLAKVSNQLVISKPTRPAPPPPPPQPYAIPNDTYYNSSRTHSLTDSSESLNVSLNVTMSPVSGRPPQNQSSSSNRHTTAISVHPEHSAFTASGYDSGHHSPRSYTSVNFTLRKPGDSPQSPIDITAGPSLTYSSRSYDARGGYQSHLAITVGGNGGSICASRTRPRNNYAANNNNCRMIKENSDESMLENINPLTGLPANVDSIANSTTALGKAEVVHRQLLCKQRLSVELENEKKRLQIMLREITVLQSPLPIGSCTSLCDEIKRLRNNCNQMAQEVEEASPSSALGETNEAFYQNIYTGQRLPVQQNRPDRPPRPPPPYILRCLSGNPMAAAANNLHNNFNGLHMNDNVGRNHGQNINNNEYLQQQEGGQPWTCNMCTFQNHPLLNKCEQCEMPLLSTSGTTTQQLNQIPSASFLTPPLSSSSSSSLTDNVQPSSVVVQSAMAYNSSIIGFVPGLTQQH